LSFSIFAKSCRAQGDVYRLQSKLETSQTECDRLAMEVDKNQMIASKLKEDNKRLHEEFTSLQVS